MASYGEIRFRLNKLAQAAGIDLDLLDGWIEDRHREILDELQWQRLEAQGALQTVAEYNAGTLTATEGSNAVTGAGTVWTAAMSYRIIRIANREEYYEFTRVTGTSGTLDRAYEGDTGAGLSYRINKSIYQMPVDLRILQGVGSAVSGGPLKRMSLVELNELFARRTGYGNPLYYAPYMDYPSDPPVPQIEFYPIPTEVTMFPYRYVYDAAVPSGTSVTLLPWMRPAALIAGVQADMAALKGDFAGAGAYDARFQGLVAQMRRIEAARIGPKRIKTARSNIVHRVRRWLK